MPNIYQLKNAPDLFEFALISNVLSWTSLMQTSHPCWFMRTLCSSCCRCKRTHVLGLCQAGIVSHTSTSHLLTGPVRTLELLLCVSEGLQVVCDSVFTQSHISAVTNDPSPSSTRGLDKLPQTLDPRQRVSRFCCNSMEATAAERKMRPPSARAALHMEGW